MKRKVLTTTLLTALCLLLGSVAWASTTWYVNGVSGSDSNSCTSATTACKTIGHAISLAASGDSIMVAAATYTEDLTISINLTVVGSGASTTIINGGGVGRVVTISSTSAHVTLSKVDITNGCCLGGAGILNNGTLRLINSAVNGNKSVAKCLKSCGAAGGGIYNSVGATLTIRNSTVTGNLAQVSCLLGGCSAFGGGIYNGGTLAINKSTLRGNHAQGLRNFGGGIYNPNATLIVNNSTLSGNRASAGSGIAGYGGTLTINNSTFSGNYGDGIAVGLFSSGGTLIVSNSTVSANSGNGISNSGSATLALQNSIVWSNTGGNCAGTITSNGFNLSSDATCPFTNTGDLNNTDPMLGPLQYNGGPTQTMALPSGSPAVDAGNPVGCTDGLGHLLKTDQRGKPRPDLEDTGGCDMGAFERQSD